jgi:hypothetical protein
MDSFFGWKSEGGLTMLAFFNPSFFSIDSVIILEGTSMRVLFTSLTLWWFTTHACFADLKAAKDGTLVEDFEGNLAGWDVLDASAVDIGEAENGHYLKLGGVGLKGEISLKERTFKNFTMEVKVRKLYNPGQASMGIRFRKGCSTFFQEVVGACRFPLSLETYVAPEVWLEFGFAWLICGADGHFVRPVVSRRREVAFLGGEDSGASSQTACTHPKLTQDLSVISPRAAVFVGGCGGTPQLQEDLW